MVVRTWMCLLSAAALVQPAAAQTLRLSRADQASTAGARAIAVGDFDHDGWPDIAHANAGADTVSILLNKAHGAGPLTRVPDIPVGHGPFDMVAADFNLDTNIDLAVANADNDSISVLLNRGDGTFTRTDIPAPRNPRGITASDLNADGRPDLIFSEFAINTVRVLLGDGTGGFTDGGGMTGVANRPQGVAAADFDRDGRVDLVVAYASVENGVGLAILPQLVNGTFTAKTIPGETNLNVVATGDFNRDGWTDVAAASSGNSRLAVYLGGPNGLRQTAVYRTGPSPRGLEVVDLNRDGWPDVITANKEGSTIDVFLGNGAAPGTFTSTAFASGAGARDVASADFNHDGRPDLATGNQDASSATVLWNDTLFERAAFGFRREETSTIPSSVNIRTVDLNHNGKPDLIGEGSYVIDGTTPGQFPRFMNARDVADFNHDGRPDVIAVEVLFFPTRTLLHLLAGDGHDGFNPMGDVPSPGLVREVSAADMNRDGLVDVVTVGVQNENSSVGVLDVTLQRPDGSWAPPVRTLLSSRAADVEIADLNRDGWPDVIVAHFQPGAVEVFLGGPGGVLRSAQALPLGGDGEMLKIADLNEDGSPDVVSGGWQTVEVFFGSPDGTLTAGPVLARQGARLDVADMNADGHLDIVVPYPTSEVYQGDGAGGFNAEHFDFNTFHIALADIDGDSLPDIIASGVVGHNQRGEVNHPPVVSLGNDFTLPYHAEFGEESFTLFVSAVDPDMHALTYEWRDDSGEVIDRRVEFPVFFAPGTHHVTATAFDGHGGSASDTMTLTILPEPEVVVSRVAFNNSTVFPMGSWREVDDPAAAGGVRFNDADRGAPKATSPATSPQSFVDVGFVADPNLAYKIWIRMKADNDNWSNDSVFVQFGGATRVDGTAAFRIGTTSRLDVNLEQCSNCGLSGWGWRDERWGPTLNSAPVLLRFPQGGFQRMIIQTREDGVSIDQIVLSAEKHRTAPPGPAKNDATIIRP